MKFGLFAHLAEVRVFRFKKKGTIKVLKLSQVINVVSTGNGFGVVGEDKRKGRRTNPSTHSIHVKWPRVVICEVEDAGLISCSGRARYSPTNPLLI